MESRWLVWDDPAAPWDDFDLTVLRSAWDYAERRDDFLAWAASLPRVLNALAVLDWSTDKERYFTDLAAARVPIVPTRFIRPGGRLEDPPPRFVVKPAVSAGGRSSAWFDDPAAGAALLERIHADGRTAMVQPYLGDVAETALVYIGGRYSHALTRRVPLPAARDPGNSPFQGLFLNEELGPAEPTAEERRVADAALAAAPGELLYARVDLVDGVVGELELAEPSLYLAFGDGAADRFADAIARAAAPSQR
jgi:hypothetical protein